MRSGPRLTCDRRLVSPPLLHLLLMHYLTSLLVAGSSLAVALSSAAISETNHIVDELEHLLVDTDGFNDARFQKAITPCSNYVSGSQLLGRETAAQWIRVAFHDFATADVHSGTGGIDASIGFETLRPENSGSAMNDSLGFFAPFVNAHVSMADLIALSVIMSVGTCSSPNIIIPLRGGRIDATEGGLFGVPEPETDLETTLSQFSQAGFYQADAIGLTVCGHSLGSVHHGGFPQVVPESAVTPTNQGGGIHFDATPDIFDVDVLNEYLDWKGQRGGPLVTTDNITVRSDLRLYLSDNNATLQGLARSSSDFTSSCVSLLTRMINTVPASAQLTDIIQPVEVKPVNVSLTVDSAGRVSFSGYIRLLSSNFESTDLVSITWRSRSGQQAPAFAASATLAGTGNSSIFGATFYHFFNAIVDPDEGISSYTVKILQPDGKPSSSHSVTFLIEDTAIFLSAETATRADGNIALYAAILSAVFVHNVTAEISAPYPQSGTISPALLKSEVTFVQNGTRGLYNLFTAAIPAPPNLRQSTLDLIAYADGGVVYRDEFRRIASVGSN
ncbi:peroxidase [Favolaschia claudopus]|uniref:Peroxidase n=1 Tax=Favolaschia claudopus TaxID=2862362 RepID=A0AAW0DGJ2_9AGAR